MKYFKGLLVNLAVTIASVACFLLFLEVITRGILYFEYKAQFRNRFAPSDAITSDSLGFLIQPNSNPKIIYELRPKITAHYHGLVKINLQGWRSDRDFSLDKSPSTVRIAGLGDSHMFGQGVNQNENAMSFLEQELNQRFPEKNWEVINAAVPGYNTVMEVETLEEKILPYKPDIIIIEFICNDLDLPNFIYEPFSPGVLSRLYFWEWVRHKLRIAEMNFFTLKDAPLNSSRSWGFENNPVKVPPAYKDMVGWDAYVKAMVKLKRMQQQYHFYVINLLTWPNQRVYSLSKRMNFYTLRNPCYSYTNPLFIISQEDRHPSVSSHQKTADLLIDFMFRKGII